MLKLISLVNCFLNNFSLEFSKPQLDSWTLNKQIYCFCFSVGKDVNESATEADKAKRVAVKKEGVSELGDAEFLNWQRASTGADAKDGGT